MARDVVWDELLDEERGGSGGKDRERKREDSREQQSG